MAGKSVRSAHRTHAVGRGGETVWAGLRDMAEGSSVLAGGARSVSARPSARPRSLSRFVQPQRSDARTGLTPGAGAELLQDRGDVVVDGPRRDHQLFRDLGVRQA